ncbi:p21-C-terminal region-binding protein-domain-containing protein [Annulohypoxylon maeteangense]|uniref:p21-C-terminal region-binding protein-domain-containing protein n=1 Tax=Annulohypoxylon maeteangense TaxID=1927788 RepID=UPI002007B98E|nr:p21-C-terminal region-binding protein-domain-containing protein [Annulohypoxylon maeteangense]KAI0889226.1 p21-C-terminal region-binding protein-domain-containing protein [Annulohypoxylon maeteangense]
MAKKRAREADGAAEAPEKMVEDGDSSDDDDFDMVNVDFEWFNFDPEIDFHGTKSLLRQLLDIDAALFDISGLADLILSQPTIGSTVKVDGKETDAYAFLTALNLHEHREKKPLADLAKYISQKAGTNQALAGIPELLSSGKHVGLVLSERLINMPSEIAPPMYGMLIDEIEAAVEDKEPYEFSHYLIISKTYHEIESTLDVEERKRKKGKQDATMFYFHPEDEVLLKHAAAYGSYDFTKIDEAIADSKRAFQEMGVMPRGFMILIEASKFADAAKAISEYLSPPS